MGKSPNHNVDFAVSPDPSTFTIVLDNQRFSFTESQLLTFRRAIDQALAEARGIAKKPSTLIETKDKLLNRMRNGNGNGNGFKIPNEYSIVFASPCDKRSGYASLSKYVYFVDGQRNYAFKIVNPRHEYPIMKLGKIEDRNSMIGKFLSILPRGKPLIKLDMKALANYHLRDDQHLKAIIDILEYEKYLMKDDYPTRKGKTFAYVRTNRVTEYMEVPSTLKISAYSQENKIE